MGRYIARGPLPLRSVSLAILLSLLATACVGVGEVRVLAGNRPNIERLESSLRLGESTREHVLAVLGEPSGRGRAMFPPDPSGRAVTIWSYRYIEGTVRDPRGTYLLVFFDGDRYEGYLWYSSLPE